MTRVARDAADWERVSLPTDADLVAVTATRTGAVAVGEDGTVVARESEGWTTLVGVGPTAAGNDLTGVAATDCGRRVWFVGGSGAIGSYDLTSGRKHDYTAPMEKTSTWEAVAVAGEAGGERLLLANGSGELLSATVGESGAPIWDDPVKPGTGSTIPAVALGPLGGVACDTSGHVFRFVADEWRQIGVRNAEVDFFDVAVGDDRLWVAGDDGLCYRYDPGRENWTPVAVGEETLRGLAWRDASGTSHGASGRLAVVGDSGTVAWRDTTADWTQEADVTDEDLRAVALGPVDVAVGDAVLERVVSGTGRRDQPRRGGDR
ncbi:hypothetical protein [Salinirubrum litoreum]|uniref:PQQ-like domain-containing protein n=1 Tax=Salinirubrum litoreum TaxID=1126234 RepID=A0ABD5R7Q0_9EURY|nr:hypothetical protein [Salinirubrum litoreum]